MSRKKGHKTGQEPSIGRDRTIRLTGLEPSLSGEFGSPYGRYRVPGLEAPPVPGRRRPLAVLVEYNDGTSELVEFLADSNGYDVRRARNGHDAGEMLVRLEPNLLVVGLRLPGLDGLGVIRAVREHADAAISRVPVLVMDVRHDENSVLEVFRSGGDDYLELPCELTEMLRAWQRVTGRLRRPAPLTALLNENLTVRHVAMSYLLETRPEGIERALGELLWQPDAEVRKLVRWGLQRLGTSEARAVLESSHPLFRGKK